jgi:hypothetical protein
LRPPTQAAIERTVSLEEIIKKRILEERWDGILPQKGPQARTIAEDNAVELSQEKNKAGLGELYEKVRVFSPDPHAPDVAELNRGLAQFPDRSTFTQRLELLERTSTATREKMRGLCSQRSAEKSMRCLISVSRRGPTSPM